MVDRASQVLEKKWASGLKQDRHTFNAATSVCGRARQLRIAFESLKLMTMGYGLEPDLH